MSDAFRDGACGHEKPCQPTRRWVGPALRVAGLSLLAALSLTVAGLRDVSGQAPAPKQAAPSHWTIIFRSDDPALWNTDTRGKAIPVKYAPEEFRYVRLRRMDTGEALIVRLCPEQLSGDNQPNPESRFWWNGTGKEAGKGRHLGIVEGPRVKFPGRRGMIAVRSEGWDGWIGSGFGHKYGVDDGQQYAWRGKEIPRTAFEVAVSDGPLTEDEKRSVLNQR
jgi:hypothetical protein